MLPDCLKPWGKRAFAGLFAVLAGCHGAGVQPGKAALREGFTCCNLHHEDDWINDGNYAELPMIPAGAPVKLFGYGGDRADVLIDGKPFRLGHDYGRAQESLQQWVAKIVVASDPKLKIADYPAGAQEAIRLGMVMPGMTKEQVVMSLGYPLTSENASLNAPVWRYWISSFEEYQILWGKDGLVREVVAAPTVKTRVVFQPGKDDEESPAMTRPAGKR
jgi:hypothetical protein